MEESIEIPSEVRIETPSYTEFMLMDREELDPADVNDVLDICGKED